MPSNLLTVIDTAGIQRYIFGTNNLQQNIGASYLVASVTRAWAVAELPVPHNVLDLDDPDGAFNDDAIENGTLAAEVIYAGGGNMGILFQTREQALAFTQKLSRRVLLEAPGLQLAAAHVDVDLARDALGGGHGKMNQVMEALARTKAQPASRTPFLGLGVTAEGVYTGWPAVHQAEDGRLISAESKAKLRAADAAHQRLRQLIDLGDYNVPKDMDHFGRTRGESSTIAIAHTDGNGMGARIQAISSKYPEAADNREYIAAMRRFSLSVQRAAHKALAATTDHLKDAVQVRDDGTRWIGDEIQIRARYLPMRPIVFGGDDVTFVTEGRLGLALTAYYLRAFSNQKLADGQPAYCRAGVAIVRTHYPFARAYQLAEQLCAAAKRFIREQQDENDKEGLTAMDWHFAFGGAVGDLKLIRSREYDVRPGSLLMRPLRIDEGGDTWRTWDNLKDLVQKFRRESPWAQRRNKIKALRVALRGGPVMVALFLDRYGEPALPSIQGQPQMAKNGWAGARCGYFDAIEAMDYCFLPDRG